MDLAKTSTDYIIVYIPTKTASKLIFKKNILTGVTIKNEL